MINPVVKSAVAFSDGSGLCYSAFSHNRAPLQTVARAVFDHVVAVVEHAIQTFVQVGHVITAIEIVVDKDFPVAVEAVVAALEPGKIRDRYPPNLLHHVYNEKLPHGN